MFDYDEYNKLQEKMRKEKKISVGDTIIAMGIKAKVKEIYYSDRYVEEKNGKYNIFYDVEFKDTNGVYRHWKSYFDGGHIEFKK